MNKPWALFFGILLMGCLSFADDHGAPAKQEGHGGGGEEKKAEGHGGAEEKSGTLAPWVEVENKIQILQTKIQVKEENLKHLFEEKRHLGENSPKVKKIAADIVAGHKELRELAEDYEKQLMILKYRFPERNSIKERKYDRMEVGPIEDLEKSLGIEGRMDRSVKKMRSQFPNKSQTSQAISQPKDTKKKEKDREKSIEEAPSVIMSK